jgi:2-polyprenyl-3-methyl-5-hydroxy-6-metoxy-1,4-benzoquinol methylase
LSKYDVELDIAKAPGTSHAYMVKLVGSNKRVLDVGCDTGYLGKALAALGNVTSGVEYNPVTAEEARKHLEKVVVADLETVDLVAEFGAGAFDVVVFGDVLEHLRDPLPVLRQARPLLAPGGCVVISVPNIAHGDVRLALLQGRFRYTNTGILDNTHTRFFTRETLLEFLADAGFVPVDIRRTIAGLFTTEIGVTPEDATPELIARLENDPEALTYQFVVKAVPDDAESIDVQRALEVDALRVELVAARRAVASAEAEVRSLRKLVSTKDERIRRLRSRLDGAPRERRPRRLPRVGRRMIRGLRAGRRVPGR